MTGNRYAWGERRGTTPFRSPLACLSAIEDIIGIDHILDADEIQAINRQHCRCGQPWHDKETTCKPQTKRERDKGPRWGEATPTTRSRGGNLIQLFDTSEHEPRR